MEHVEVGLSEVMSGWLPVGLNDADEELDAFIGRTLAEGHTLLPGTVAIETAEGQWRFRARVITYGRAYGLGERWLHPLPDGGDHITAHLKKPVYLH
jgi:hypothetical protein